MNDPVADQLLAYNQRDVDAFMTCFSQEVRVLRGDGTVRLEGWNEVRTVYERAFLAEPNVRCEIVNRVRHGKYAIDHERLTGYVSGATKEAVAIYTVEDGLIATVQFLD